MWPLVTSSNFFDIVSKFHSFEKFNICWSLRFNFLDNLGFWACHPRSIFISTTNRNRLWLSFFYNKHYTKPVLNPNYFTVTFGLLFISSRNQPIRVVWDCYEPFTQKGWTALPYKVKLNLQQFLHKYFLWFITGETLGTNFIEHDYNANNTPSPMLFLHNCCLFIEKISSQERR